MQRGLVSIIIPTFNRKNFITEAVESCIQQTYKKIEIIIVDDGSTDGTEELVKQQQGKEWLNKPIRYYKQLNSGASAARNKGVEVSNGEFIQFLDSDDILFPPLTATRGSRSDKRSL